jgi:oligopeptide transport system substrate-binding protein
VMLRDPVPFFLALAAMFTYSPVPRHVIERYGAQWTEAGHIVGNGPFVLVAHRANSKFEFARNDRYWDAANIALDRVIAYSVDDNHTSANLYESGMLDWLPSNYFPAEYASYLRAFKDMHSAPFLGILYYTFNVTRPPLNNPLVRRALAMAVDRRAITDDLLQGGQIPTSHFVPIGMPGYQSPTGVEYDPKQAAALLAQAGYPDGKGFPTFNVLFNINESRKRITESIQQMWARNLKINVTIRNEEWGSYLKTLDELNYDIALQTWVADYPDPTTYTDLLESNNGNNRTGWKSVDYDRLLSAARKEPDPHKRMRLLRDAEAIVLKQSVVMPIYTFSSNDLIKPYVHGLFPSPLDLHLLNRVRIDRNWSAAGAVAEARR